MKNLRNLVLLLIVVFIWGANWANMKIGLQYVTPMNYLWQRLFFSTLMIAPFLLLARGGMKREPRVLGIVVVSASAWVISNIFMMYALGSTSSGISAILTYTQPLFVFGMSALLLRGEVTVLKVGSSVFGFIGIAVIYLNSLGGGLGSAQAVIYLLVAAFLWAASIVGYKMVSGEVHPYWFSFVEVAIGSVLVLPFALASGGLVVPLEPGYLLSIGYLAVLSTVVAFFIWFRLLQNEDAVTVSTSSLLVPIIAFAVGAVTLGEVLSLNEVVGVVMVLISVYFVNYSPFKGPTNKP